MPVTHLILQAGVPVPTTWLVLVWAFFDTDTAEERRNWTFMYIYYLTYNILWNSETKLCGYDHLLRKSSELQQTPKATK